MKRYIEFLILAASAVVASSCEKSILSQSSPSSFESEKIFSNYSLARSAVDGILEAALASNGYPFRYLCFYGYNTDIEISLNFAVNESYIQRYMAGNDHQRLNGTNEPFSILYQSVERANLAIEGLEKYGNISKDEKMRVLHAQALTYRAGIYYDLVKGWGDVPARFEPVSEKTLYLHKSNRDVIFKQILSDLDRAIPDLPYPGEHELTQDAYHINRIYAAGLYARIAMTASGYALRPADDRIGTGDAGEVRISSDPEMAKSVLYPKALKHLADVIAANKMTLAANYKEYWHGVSNSEAAGKPTEESVWIMPIGSNAGRWAYSFAVRTNNTTMLYGYSVKVSPLTGPAPTFYFDFDRKDKRRKVTCFNSQMQGTSAIKSSIAQWYFGKFRLDQMEKNPFAGANTDCVKPVIMRYSDILLMAAELENETGTLAKAKEYMRPVRVRAFDQESADQFLGGITDKQAMFRAIVNERAFEFCGEQLRKADLIRWNMLKSSMDETKSKMYELRDRTGRYSYLPADIYYKVNPDDPWELLIYGFDEGETGNPGAGWTKLSRYFSNYDDSNTTSVTALTKTKIESVYGNDPDTRQYWPVPANAVTNSQGYIVNDYGY